MTGKSYTCHNCPKGLGAHCARCRRVDQDDIRIQHSPHNRAELQATTTHPPSEQATALPAEIEDKLRRFLFDLFDLDPIQLLLLRHVKQGGTPATFGRHFAAFLKSSIIYGKRKHRARWERTCQEIGAWISRATAWAIWDGMVNKSPLLAVFQTWEPRHGGRQADDFTQEDARQVQMLLDLGIEEGG